MGAYIAKEEYEDDDGGEYDEVNYNGYSDCTDTDHTDNGYEQ